MEPPFSLTWSFTMKYNRGGRVTCNGNHEGVVIGVYSEEVPGSPQYLVRLWDGTRHVGDVVTSQRDLDIENQSLSDDLKVLADIYNSPENVAHRERLGVHEFADPPWIDVTGGGSDE